MSTPGLEQASRRPAVAGTEPAEAVASDPETGKAIGLAAATMAANLVQVVFTVVFTRLLGADGYGSLAALLNVTVILFVPGAALQVAAAREATLGRLGRGGELAGTLARWSRHILMAVVAIAVLSVVVRRPLADLINVDQEWAAAAVPITGMLWLLLCQQRGLLQSARAYREVGLSILLEALGRLAMGIALVALGLGVTGAYLGTVASLVVTGVALAWVLRRRLGPPAHDTRPHPLPALARGAALPIAALIGVQDVPWAAAAIPPTGVLWMLLSLQRAALQGLRAYRPVGVSIIAEAAGRLACALVLVGLGFGVTGALLGLPLAFVLVSLWLERELVRVVGPVQRVSEPLRTLRSLVGDGWVPIIGLFLLASLQNVDVILAKHQLGGDAAGSYAAAAVAAKAVVWVAIGVGLHLLPEATRRAAAGLDPRPVLLRALSILALVAAPALLIFAVAPELLLRLAFGPGFTDAADALLLLGAAMTLLAVAYLTVQYMVALGETRFLWVLGVVAIAEPFLLTAGNEGIVDFATIVFGVQCVAASSILALGLTARRRRRRAAAPS